MSEAYVLTPNYCPRPKCKFYFEGPKNRNKPYGVHCTGCDKHGYISATSKFHCPHCKKAITVKTITL